MHKLDPNYNPPTYKPITASVTIAILIGADDWGIECDGRDKWLAAKLEELLKNSKIEEEIVEHYREEANRD